MRFAKLEWRTGNFKKGTKFEDILGFDLKTGGKVKKVTLKNVQKAKDRNKKILGPILTPFQLSQLGFGNKGKVV